MNQQTVHIESVEEILSAIKAAQAAVESGEQKARRAKALLGKVERLEHDLEQHRRQAEQEIAIARQALAEAEGLRAVLGDEFLAGARGVVERLHKEWCDRVGAVEARLEGIKAELRALDEDPELEAFLALTEHERRERTAQREARRQEFERRLTALRPGSLVGEGEDALRRLAEEANGQGFESVAGKATRAAERAAGVRAAREAARAEERRQEFIRWCSRHTNDGRLVLIRSWDDMEAVQLQPHAAASGRLYFEVTQTTGNAGAPLKYDDFPGSSRTWKALNWDAPDGDFTAEQVAFLHSLASGLRGREANCRNAALARRAAEEVAQVTGKTEVETDPEAFEGLAPAVVTRLHKAGLTTREAVEEIASDETAFLALPGLGEATLVKVRAWLGMEEPAAEPGRPGAEDELIGSGTGETPEEPEAPQEVHEQEKPEEKVEPEIVVVGLRMDGDMPGTRLTEWRGMAHTLLPILRADGVGRLELLIEETYNGNGPEVGILASWKENAVEITVPGSGDRSCRTVAMRQLMQELRAV